MKTFYNQEVLKSRPELIHGREKRQGGTLRNWALAEGNPGVIIAVGYVTDDNTGRQNQPIRTSVVVSVDTVNKELETLNTIYRLHYK